MTNSRGKATTRTRTQAVRLILRDLAVHGVIAAAIVSFTPALASAQEATSGPRDIVPAPDATPPAPSAAPTGPAPAQTEPAAPPPASLPSTSQSTPPSLPPAPTPVPRAPADAAGQATPRDNQNPQSDQGVQIGQLTQVDAASVGTLGTAEGGLGVGMWTGTSRSLIETLLPQVPSASTSAVARNLTRRLLLTAASIPDPATAMAPADIEKSSVAILKARVDNLLAAGQLSAAAGLLGRISAQVQDESLARERADTALLTDNLQAACSSARDAARSASDAYWLKLLAYCRATSGDSGGANLALDLLRDSGESDPLFQKLFDALPPDGKTPAKPRTGVIKSLPNPAPLYLSMLKTIGHPIPSDAVENASPLVLSAIATAPNASAKLRAQAAEMAAAMGALPVSDLIKAYAAESFSTKQKSTAKAVSDDQSDSQPLGMLYQMTVSETDPKERADLLRTVWTVGQKVGAYEMIAKANLEATKSLPVSADLIGYSADIARALLVAGQHDQALAWYNMARTTAASRNAVGLRAVLDMWPLVQLADVKREQTWSPDVVNLWWNSQQVVSTEEKVSKADLLFGTLDGLGYTISTAQWQKLLTPPLTTSGIEMPSLALTRDLAAAAKDHRRGETVMLALIALGKDPLKSASPIVLGEVMRALKSVDLEAEARALALEIAVARGF